MSEDLSGVLKLSILDAKLKASADSNRQLREEIKQMKDNLYRSFRIIRQDMMHLQAQIESLKAQIKRPDKRNALQNHIRLRTR